MAELSVGDKAPDFSLSDQNGDQHTLSSYRGRYVLVYFYPKDDTPGCTKEACGVRDNFSSFGKQNIAVLGISKDSVASHKKFAEKYSLPFTLLSDPELKVMKAYGAWGQKKMMGRTYDGTLRISFLVDPQGGIAKIYRRVNPPEHASEVLADVLEELAA